MKKFKFRKTIFVFWTLTNFLDEIWPCSSIFSSSPFSTPPEARGGSCSGDGSTIAFWYCHSGRVSRCDASQYLPKTNLVGLCTCVPKLLLQARFPEEHKMTASMGTRDCWTKNLIHQILGNFSRSSFENSEHFLILRAWNYDLKSGGFIIIERKTKRETSWS